MDETPKLSSAKPGGISRREFARRAAVASAVAAVAPGAIAAPAAPSNEHATVAAADRGGPFSCPGSNALPQASHLPNLSPEDPPAVEARLTSIFSQYGAALCGAPNTN